MWKEAPQWQKKFNVPVFIIGMTIVAMGTSAPECAVSIAASVQGSNGMAISNVVGSNIFNLMVVCGVCALFSPLLIKKETLKKRISLFCFSRCDPWNYGGDRHGSGTFGRICTGYYFCVFSPMDGVIGKKNP